MGTYSGIRVSFLDPYCAALRQLITPARLLNLEHSSCHPSPLTSPQGPLYAAFSPAHMPQSYLSATASVGIVITVLMLIIVRTNLNDY